ncbi:MAG: hypothetical protein LBB14_02300 [Puniceicoccales bacterium]|jgi:hypothetical protein|nr:hypothetical protein [Puniceicoccales bacterium]
MDEPIKITSCGKTYLWGVPEDPKGARVWIGTSEAPIEGPFNFSELLERMPGGNGAESILAYVLAVNCVAFHYVFDPILSEDMIPLYFPENSPVQADKVALIRPPLREGKKIIYCARAKFLPAIPYRILGPNEMGGFRGEPL